MLLQVGPDPHFSLTDLPDLRPAFPANKRLEQDRLYHWVL